MSYTHRLVADAERRSWQPASHEQPACMATQRLNGTHALCGYWRCGVVGVDETHGRQCSSRNRFLHSEGQAAASSMIIFRAGDYPTSDQLYVL